MPDPTTPPQNTEVYAVHGADPEVLAYAMAKYSRSSLTLRESLREIGASQAEQFLNTFYFAYGHRSIADLAHLAFAVERLSLLAAIVLVDEQRWDGQERSTRYQDFERTGWYTPHFANDSDTNIYNGAAQQLFDAYRTVAQDLHARLKDENPRPTPMSSSTYERTLRARAFDSARYLLPLCANTSLGQIVNARTLETQVSRLLSHPLPEIQALGESLRQAASAPAWNPHADEQNRLATLLENAGEPGAATLRRSVKAAPTLLKYAVPNPYAIESRTLLAQAAQALMGSTPIASAPLVDLVETTPNTPDFLEIDLAASLLYPACHYPFRQLRDHIAALPAARRNELIDLGFRHRGTHDELLRELAAGHSLRFDILMDIGGFRDMHRHRRCSQLLQPFTARHGWEAPENLGDLEPLFTSSMQAAAHAGDSLAPSSSLHKASPGPTQPTPADPHKTAPNPAWSATAGEAAAQYLLPLATRTRALFRMDFAQALYIAELRSAPQGHLSYRRVAWEMYRAIERQHPTLAKHFRVSEVDTTSDLFKR